MRQANDTQTKITMSPRAWAQVEKSFIERTIAEAWAEVEGHLPCYEGRAEFAVDALSEAGFAIVRKPKPGSTAADRVEFARRTGNWSGVSDRDYMDWVRSLVPAGFVFRTVAELTTENEKAFLAAVEALDRDKAVPTDRVVDVTHVKADGTDETVRHAEYTQRPKETVTFETGNVLTLPPGTEIRSADTATPEPERDYLGLRENSADDLAARYGCRVEIVGMDDADTPLTDEGIVGDPQYVVVTERATGRHVALVEAWETDDGDPLVPQAWLSTVLSAWDAARDPQRAA